MSWYTRQFDISPISDAFEFIIPSYAWKEMAKASIKRFLLILIVGMGNVKHGNWKSILVYFSFMLVLGLCLYYLIHDIISPRTHIQPISITFLVLIYLVVTFFWDGSFLLGRYQEDGKHPAQPGK